MAVAVYLERKRICGMVDGRTGVHTYVRTTHNDTIHANVGLAQARPNNAVATDVADMHIGHNRT